MIAGIDLNTAPNGSFPIVKSPFDLPEKPDVIIDFSNSSGLDELLSFAEEKNKPVVVATTGTTGEQMEKIRKTACAAYKSLDATGLSRVDFFIDKDSGAVYLNEINTLPGFTSISMFPKMCEAAGLQFPELIKLLLDEAVQLYNAKKSLITSR